MTLNVKDPEAHNLAAELSRITGESLTQTVIKALRERLQRETGKQQPTDLAEELVDIGRHCASLPILDPREAEEILGYDEQGIPR